MATFNDSTPRNPIEIDSDVLDSASAKLGGAHAVLDALFTLAATGDIEGLRKGSLASAIDEAMQLVESARELLSERKAAA